jgi:dethiobiotin synthetase
LAKIIFITGTDTGVGKTVLTALLLSHLRASGVHALAMKPFSSGGREDARHLLSLEENLLTLDEVNPFFFDRPVAPAALAKSNTIRLDDVARKIRIVASGCDVLLVEGIGGLLVPLNGKMTVRDLILRLKCPVFVVSRNRLGTINHTLLTLESLEVAGVKDIKVVMMGQKAGDASVARNSQIIQKMSPKTPVLKVPHINFLSDFPREIKINAKYLKKTLARILRGDSFITVRPRWRKTRLINKTG